MKLSLLFLESLKKQIKKLLRTYPSLDETTIRLLNSADPTGDEAKYTKWLTQQYVKGNIDLDDGFTQRQEIYDKLAIFNKNPWKFPSNDIYKLNIKDLLETEAVSDSKIDYSELLQPPNRLLKETGNYKLIEINAYQGMEQFKKESDTVPARWCIAYPNMFNEYGPPMYLTIKDEEPYVMIVYHKDELKDRNDKPITFDVFKELLDIGFIDVSKLEFTEDSVRFKNYFLSTYNFNELLELDNIKLLIYYLYKDPSVKDKVVSIILSRNDYKAAEIYGNIIKDNYELLKKLILKNMDNPEWAYWYAKNVIEDRWEPAEKIIINSKDLEYAYKYAMDVIEGRWEPTERMIIDTKNPEYAYEYSRNVIKSRWEPAEKIILNSDNPSWACYYATSVIKGRWEPVEKKIINSNNPGLAYKYAKDAIKYRWEPAERMIINSNHPELVLWYAKDVIKGRWESAEKMLINSNDLDNVFLYVQYVLKRRWEPVEKMIINSNNPKYAKDYANIIIKGRWEPAEKIIANSDDAISAYWYTKDVMGHRWEPAERIIANSDDPTIAYWYARDFIGHRWEPAEKIIANSDDQDYAATAYSYTKDLIGHRWEPAEKMILNSHDAQCTYLYIRDVIKDRWPEAEPIIKQNKYYWSQYQEFLRKLQK